MQSEEIVTDNIRAYDYLHYITLRSSSSYKTNQKQGG